MNSGRNLHDSRDIRDTDLYRVISSFYAALHAPGEGRVTDAADIVSSPDGRFAAFTGTIYTDLGTRPVTRVCLVELDSKRLRILPAAAGNDRLPQWSPDGSLLAFVSDRAEAANFQLYLHHEESSCALPAAKVEGMLEYLRWSPDGTRILLGVAGFGADLAGCQGGHKVMHKAGVLPPWAPQLDTGDADNLWRKLYVFHVADASVRSVSPANRNVWEAAWLGNEGIVAVTSDSHAEGSWYRARLQKLTIMSGAISDI